MNYQAALSFFLVFSAPLLSMKKPDKEVTSALKKVLNFPGKDGKPAFQRNVNLSEIEPICKEKFIRLIKRQEQDKRGFILAYLFTRKNNKTFEHSFSAEILNKWLFNGMLLPSSNEIDNPINPVNGVHIATAEDINYFAINDTASEFFYIGNAQNLMTPDKLRITLNSLFLVFHDPQEVKQNPIWLPSLAIAYLRGAYIPKNLKYSEQHFRNGAAQDHNKKAQALSYVGLGLLYSESLPKNQHDYQFALDCWQKAYNQNSFLVARWHSCIGFAHAHQYGKGVPQNAEKAISYLKEVIEDKEINPEQSLWISAHQKLADIYWLKENYSLYISFLLPVVFQDTFKSAKADALWALAQLFSGKKSVAAIEKDIEIARYCYEHFIENESVLPAEKIYAHYELAKLLATDDTQLQEAHEHFKIVSEQKISSSLCAQAESLMATLRASRIP